MINAREREYSRELKYIYSIIIPHKDTPNLLQRCIDSIPDREDVQIIIVDDNSDTTKVDFDNFPGKGKPNVEIYYTKEGKGAGYARNIGLSHAKGKWVLFSDSDDYFSFGINAILEKYKCSNADIIFFNVKYTGAKYKSTNFAYELNAYMLSKPNDYLETFLRYKFGPPWGKIIDLKLITENNIRFDEVPKNNDTMFSLQIGYAAKKIIIEKNEGYIYECRDGSISTSAFSKELYICSLTVAYSYYSFIVSHPDLSKTNGIHFLVNKLLSNRGKYFFSGTAFLVKKEKLSVFNIVFYTIIFGCLNILKHFLVWIRRYK